MGKIVSNIQNDVKSSERSRLFHFESWPPINPQNWYFQNCGFITFDTARSAERAILELNGTSVEGIDLKVNISYGIAKPGQIVVQAKMKRLHVIGNA